MQTGLWLQFEIAGERYALPVETVAKVIGLSDIRPVGTTGWAGLLTLKNGLLPLADGHAILGCEGEKAPAGRGLVLRGRQPLGLTVDDVLGVTAGVPYPLVSRVGLPEPASAALPTENGAVLVLDADLLWHRLWAGLERQPDGSSYRLKPLQQGARTAGPLSEGSDGQGSIAKRARAARRPAKKPAAAETKSRTRSAATTRQTASRSAAADEKPAADKKSQARVGKARVGKRRRGTEPAGLSSEPAPVRKTAAKSRRPKPAPLSPEVADSTLRETAAETNGTQANVETWAGTNDPQAIVEPAAATASPEVPAAFRVLVFRAGLEADLAVPLDQVLAVGPECAARPLPNGPRHLAGLVRWRDRLLPLVDLPSRVGGADTGPRQTLYLSIHGRAARALAVRIGEVAGRAEVPEAILPPPQAFGVPPSWIRGAARLGDRPLLVLDPQALFAA
jgi:chemotaxis signal transduction protein